MTASDGATVPMRAGRANLAAIETYLTRTHGLPLGKDGLDGIEYVARNFQRFGPDINHTSSINDQRALRGVPVLRDDSIVAVSERRAAVSV